MTPRRSTLLIHGSLLLVALIWGVNFAAIKYLLRRLEPLDVAFVRTGGAALCFVVVLLASRRPIIALRRADLVRLILIGVVGISVMTMAMIWGQSLLPAALASLIVTSNPIHTAIISRILTGEPLTPRKIGGIALAFAGFLIVLLYGSGNEVDLSGGHVKGMLILAIAPFAWAIYTVMSKPLLGDYPSVHVAGYAAIFGSLAFLSVPVVDHGALTRILDLNPLSLGAALFSSAGAITLGYLLWYRGLRVLTPSQTAVYMYFVPVFGLLAAWLLLGEAVTRWILLGGAAILAGVVLTNSRSRRSRIAATPALDATALPDPAAVQID